MSVQYRPVQWTSFKRAYDAILIALVLGYVNVYQALSRALFRGAEALSPPILAMRAWGSCAFLLLTLILCTGPLARLDRRFLPLLYNRRHAGVVMCWVALMHAWQVLGFYFAWGKESEWAALLDFDGSFTSAGAPFIRFGVAALAIIVLMAVTSHDFWQRFLGPTVWKSLHMLVYVAYFCAVVHVAFGALQREGQVAFALLVVTGALLVLALHGLAARREVPGDRPERGLRAPGRCDQADDVGWLDAGPVDVVPEGHARSLCPPSGERIALVNRGGLLYAIHGVCAHQRGPLYEGRVKDGCLTCPWHGWQYRPEDGRSPPPFQEVLPTYRLRLKDGRVLVDPRPLPPGTKTEPIRVSPRVAGDAGAAREVVHG